MPKLNALIAGSTGYIGIQLIKLLVKHKYINIKYLCGNSSVGKKVSYYDKTLSIKKLTKIIKFNKNLLKDIDVISVSHMDDVIPHAIVSDESVLKDVSLVDMPLGVEVSEAEKPLNLS